MRRQRGSKHIDKMDEQREFIIRDGSCIIGVCGEEAACKDLENNTYTCVCPHDSRPPTSKGTCPRKIVPVDPGRIPNVQPPSNKQIILQNSTIARVHQSTVENFKHPNYFLMMTLIFAGFSLFILLGIYVRRKLRSRHLNNAGASPINLKHSLLLAERYAPNPQYSACSGTGVPVLRKETLKFLNEIGEGCFGKVYKGELLVDGSDQPQIVAIKVLKENASREAEEDFIREVEIMSAFKHPNILSLLGMVIQESTANPMMVFEHMPHGDLAELLRAQKNLSYKVNNNDDDDGGDDDDADNHIPKLTRKDLLSIALQIANGMKYLAAQRFVHRDLACRNCLVADGPIVKIADFGMSRDVYTCDYYKIGGSRLLPVRWMSPESVLYGRFTLESDIWSFGVLLWEIYSYGKQPYYGHTNEEAVKLILDGIMLIPPEDCPSLICELMKNCWKTEPRDRIKFQNVCDKLELAYENYDCESIVNYEDEKKNSTMLRNCKSLPRPPPLSSITKTTITTSHNIVVDDDDVLLDDEGYLLAKEIKEPVQYLETLPD